MAKLRMIFGLLALLILVGCRNDMHDQPRFKPLAKSDFFPDMRASRAPVENTVARGQLNEDTYFYTGKVGANPGDYMAVVSEIIPCFSRKRVFGYNFVAMSSIAIAVIGFLVWAHHMFVAGISLYSALVFSFLTFLVAVPSAIKVFNWTATMGVNFTSPA